MNCGIYKITSPTGRIYVGSSKDLKRRENEYRLNHCKGQTRLYNSINKYGWDAHTFEVVLICKPENRLMYEHIIGKHKSVKGWRLL